MATVIIDNSCTQAEQLLNYISTLPFVTVVKDKKKSFAEASAECNAISTDEFIDELKARAKQRYRNAQN
jgi:hypothetical protein